MRFSRGYLSLNAVQASEPEDLPPAELALSMIDFFQVLQLLQLLVWDFFLLRSMTSTLKELQPARWNRGDDLNEGIDVYQVAISYRKESSNSVHCLQGALLYYY